MHSALSSTDVHSPLTMLHILGGSEKEKKTKRRMLALESSTYTTVLMPVSVDVLAMDVQASARVYSMLTIDAPLV